MRNQTRYGSFLFLLLGLLSQQTGYGQVKDTLQLPLRILNDAQIVSYKQVGTTDLRLSIVYPPNYKPDGRYPAIVFFFGGGWVNGDVRQFEPQCRYLAGRGMVAITADYRVKNRQGTTPAEAVQDAKSAIRWLRTHAQETGIDPDRLVAAGGSAGGHVALATATLPGFNEPGEDTTISCRPNALVLFNPVVKTTPGGFGYERMGGRAGALSPVAHIHPGMPPVILFHGTADDTVPIGNVEELCQRMQSMNNSCQLHAFPGQKHGFFNYTRDRSMYDQTLALTAQFLVSLGYISAEPERKSR